MKNNTTRLSLYEFISTQDILFASLYSFIIIFGVTGNCLVIIIVRKTPSMHTTTNYLLMNLAVADLVTLLFCPGLYDFALTSVRLQGLTGDLICKLFAGNAIIQISINASVLTVCTIAVERYLALVKPFHTTLRMSKTSVGYVVAMLWIVAVVSCIPDITTNTFNISASSRYPCKHPWTLQEYTFQKPYIIFTCICFGFVSSLVVSFCYIGIVRGLYFTKTICSASTITEAERREKKQLARLLVWLSLAFAICILPYVVFFMFLGFADTSIVQSNYDKLYFLYRIFQFLLISNSFWNPILYACQSSNYRNRLRHFCTCGKIVFFCSFRKETARVAHTVEADPGVNGNRIALKMAHGEYNLASEGKEQDDDE
ncbi:QRFP-like peptide receptor [Montipora capricornis]|uniref:QRFP-like peptide receptor n=1 Tax=Montipora capricornis TaxID=246305 RepID=UPI0035F109F8